MREFMDYIQSAFYSATGWNRESSYSTLNATSDALLNFPTPRGLRLTLSSLATPQFATTYQLGTIGVVDGSISYLYSSVPLNDTVAQSDRIPLSTVLKGYRTLAELPRHEVDSSLEATATKVNSWSGFNLMDTESLAYGRLYLPRSMLEALFVKRISPTLQMQMSAVSDQSLRNGGTVLSMLQYDTGRYGVEGLASTDGGLLGIRGLYNFGGDVADTDLVPSPVEEGSNHNNNSNNERDRIYGRFSAGGEFYYGTLNKSGGMSLGVRFATLPRHKGTPLTATMTINPLMGNMSWTYAVMAGENCSLATRTSFNVYSYESDYAVGLELWRKRSAWQNLESEDDVKVITPTIPQRSFQSKLEWKLDEPTIASPLKEPVAADAGPTVKSVKPRERSFQAKLEWRLDDAESMPAPGADTFEDPYAGVLKARLDQHFRVGLLWEGRIKSLLFSLGSSIDLRRPDSPFRNLGLEVQFSS
ncbi:mitochondrial inheritance component MDM10 [Microdochium trichocladiopsis]|uniref:Mitochondrial distribution and morphology protein 10 n=1 Tax=Microdochium trichocladiopsis TaxID=1682393 RepID=A0A9P9BWG1_9PEZI|nr:mitochondrial inheritance component MDM10 [Microdochium trichocladiopsis]KAH7041368.1 mitochondrial inheritance component MDM10 [Microdochium trichocladiopsis]